jgi:hypothetical protein
MNTRQIIVSTDTYAAIWAERRPGEDNEDAVLRRVLHVPSISVKVENSKIKSNVIGFRDPRFGIELKEGFEIFRTYQGKEYRATAVGGMWRLENTGAEYPSLNQLSRAIGTSVENAWRNWYFTDSNGKRQLVQALRK